MEKEKCACDTCTSNLHWERDCFKVIRQRLHQRPYRTCPLCQIDIPQDQFDRNDSHGHIKFVSKSEVTCAGKSV